MNYFKPNCYLKQCAASLESYFLLYIRYFLVLLHIMVSFISLCSRLWFRQIPSEQHDGCYTLWLSNVHGNVNAKQTSFTNVLMNSSSFTSFTFATLANNRLLKLLCPRTMMPRLIYGV